MLYLSSLVKVQFDHFIHDYKLIDKMISILYLIHLTTSFIDIKLKNEVYINLHACVNLNGSQTLFFFSFSFNLLFLNCSYHKISSPSISIPLVLMTSLHVYYIRDDIYMFHISNVQKTPSFNNMVII